MQIRPEEITQILKTQLSQFEKRLDVSETGTVVSVGDGVAKVYGLEKAARRASGRRTRRERRIGSCDPGSG